MKPETTEKVVSHGVMAVLNLLVIGAVVLITFVAKWVGWEACFAFVAGFIWAQVGFRLTYGFWSKY